MSRQLLGEEASICKDYANSTLLLNQALNAELALCYDRIQKMIRELAHAESVNLGHLKQIQRLNQAVSKLVKPPVSPVVIRFPIISVVSSPSQTDFQSVLSLQPEICIQSQLQLNDRIRDQDVELLLTSKLELQYELQIAHNEVSSLTNITLHNRHQLQTTVQRLQQTQSQLQQQYKQKSILIEEHQRMFRQTGENHSIINFLEDKNRQLQQNLVVSASENAKLEASLRRRIKELEDKFGAAGVQSRPTMDGRETERRHHRSVEIRQQAPLQIDFKLLKQEYIKVTKQNIKLVETISKLEKTNMFLVKDIDQYKKERVEHTRTVSQFRGEIEEMVAELSNRQYKIQELGNIISSKQSEYNQLIDNYNHQFPQGIHKESKHLKLESLLTQPSNFNYEVPVRDSSIMTRSRSTTKGFNTYIKNPTTVRH